MSSSQCLRCTYYTVRGNCLLALKFCNEKTSKMSDASKLVETMCKNKWFKDNDYIIPVIEDTCRTLQNNANKK